MSTHYQEEALLHACSPGRCSQGGSWPRARKPLWEVCGRCLVLFTLMLARLPAEPQKRQHTLGQLMGELFAYMRYPYHYLSLARVQLMLGIKKTGIWWVGTVS